MCKGVVPFHAVDTEMERLLIGVTGPGRQRCSPIRCGELPTGAPVAGRTNIISNAAAGASEPWEPCRTVNFAPGVGTRDLAGRGAPLCAAQNCRIARRGDGRITIICELSCGPLRAFAAMPGGVLFIWRGYQGPGWQRCAPICCAAPTGA